ncbi:TonB-dependent receptor family protein [Thalassotalea profundi]|uniref:TonB-dependent receptor n=1 Tax=Thalassotalea profundi TaxID=2036687 RepID=A0ABQ3IJ15_9GAMM|nr:TonB-dependent receptor [Thalassotalea profundi]GHE81836.1 TonB-dependent receptor [Thalassotalea profundi]
MLLFRYKPLSACFSLSLALPLITFANENNTVNTSDEQLEKIVVLGTQSKLEIETEQALTPGGVSIIDSDEFYKRNVSTLADMLRFVPGVWTTSGSAGDSTFFSSRGSNLDATNYDGNGIKLLQDGLPVTAADGNNHNRIVDPLSTRYAIVARGSNALTYGASTLGGAINFISPTAHDMEAFQVYLNAGSHGKLEGRATAATVNGDFDAIVTLEKKRLEGYRGHQNQERDGFYLNAGWKFNEDVRTRFYFTYIDNNQELPGGLSQEQFDEDPYQGHNSAIVGNYQYDVEMWRIANNTIWNIDENSSLSVGISYEDQALYHPIVYNPYFSLLIDTDQKNLGTSLRYNFTLNEHNILFGINYAETTVTGGNYEHESGIHKGISTIVDNKADSLEVFLVDRWQFAPNWKLIYGIQAVSASRNVKNTNAQNNTVYNPKADYNSINPRVGLIYQWSDSVELFANVSHLYEPPTNYELEDDASPDNKALKAMQGEVIEIGTRGKETFQKSNYWHWELAFYYGKLQDEILSIDDPNAPGTSLSSNNDDTIHAGFEALLGASFVLDNKEVHKIEPLLSLTINEFSFNDDPIYKNNQLPAAPGYAIKGEILYRNANGFFIGPTFDIIDERYADFSNTYTVDNYTLIGLRTGISGESWEAFAEMRNITDEEYVSLFSVKDIAKTSDAILQAGEPRSIYIGVKFHF